MTSELATLLARLVAAQEAPWRPVRQGIMQIAAYHDARVNGVSIALRGGRARERKANQRQRDELARADLLLDAKPTQAGRRLVRTWTWPYEVSELQEAVRRIHERTVAGDCRAPDWVPETLIAGVEWGKPSGPFGMLQVLLKPLLVERVVESLASTTGHCHYRLAVPLAQALYEIGESVGEWDGEGETRREVATAYDREYRRIIALLESDREHRSDLGWIPLPASGECVSKRHPNYLDGIKPLFAEALTDG